MRAGAAAAGNGPPCTTASGSSSSAPTRCSRWTAPSGSPTSGSDASSSTASSAGWRRRRSRPWSALFPVALRRNSAEPSAVNFPRGPCSYRCAGTSPSSTRSASTSPFPAPLRWNFAALGTANLQRAWCSQRDNGASPRGATPAAGSRAVLATNRMRQGRIPTRRTMPCPSRVQAARASSPASSPFSAAARALTETSFPHLAVDKRCTVVEISCASGGEKPVPRGLKLLQTGKRRCRQALHEHARSGNRQFRGRESRVIDSASLTMINEMLAAPALAHDLWCRRADGRAVPGPTARVLRRGRLSEDALTGRVRFLVSRLRGHWPQPSESPRARGARAADRAARERKGDGSRLSPGVARAPNRTTRLSPVARTPSKSDSSGRRGFSHQRLAAPGCAGRSVGSPAGGPGASATRRGSAAAPLLMPQHTGRLTASPAAPPRLAPPRAGRPCAQRPHETSVARCSLPPLSLWQRRHLLYAPAVNIGGCERPGPVFPRQLRGPRPARRSMRAPAAMIHTASNEAVGGCR